MAARRLAILNGFGRSLGDSLIGLQALCVAQAMSAMPKPMLVRRHYGRPLVDQLYELAADFAEVLIVPPGRPDDAPAVFNDIVDMRDFVFDPAFCGTSMIDFFLARLRLDPQDIPAAMKRNAWLQPTVEALRPPGLPQRYALVCPGSSMPMRDMPDDCHSSVLRRLAAIPGLAVVTQGRSDRKGVTCVAPLNTIEALCGLVAHAELIVSTDTAMVHFADAFDVPCFAIFTTHRPEWRVRDYPGCDALYLPVPELPDALEFARSDADVEAVLRAWRRGETELCDRLDTFLAKNSGDLSLLAEAG